jgi:hypothetical protein
MLMFMWIAGRARSRVRRLFSNCSRTRYVISSDVGTPASFDAPAPRSAHSPTTMSQSYGLTGQPRSRAPCPVCLPKGRCRLVEHLIVNVSRDSIVNAFGRSFSQRAALRRDNGREGPSRRRRCPRSTRPTPHPCSPNASKGARSPRGAVSCACSSTCRSSQQSHR